MPDDAVISSRSAARIDAPWTDPLEALAPFAEEPHAALLLSGPEGWSYLMRSPRAAAEVTPDAPVPDLSDWLEPQAAVGDPPFQGGVLGLAGYEFSARLERSAPQARGVWPDLWLGRYTSLLAFHPASRRVVAIGRSLAEALAARRWLDMSGTGPAGAGVMVDALDCATPGKAHAAAVAHTVSRIEAGDLFQANLARPWRGRLGPGRTPFELFRRLAARSPAPYAAYLRLPDRALVSNSPEQFLSVRGGVVETRPIKGTRPRGDDPQADAALARELQGSAKDLAENLMIVDLMRNDLSRVCAPGTVDAPDLARLESYVNVHHLVSRVRGRLGRGRTAWDAFLAAFPPGSITGAPKLQAMKAIARHEAPRGPYCGSLFWAGADGALEASVLIRTLAFDLDAEGWRFEARAGGGIVADSDPWLEVAETEAKISAILGALAAP